MRVTFNHVEPARDGDGDVDCELAVERTGPESLGYRRERTIRLTVRRHKEGYNPTTMSYDLTAEEFAQLSTLSGTI